MEGPVLCEDRDHTQHDIDGRLDPVVDAVLARMLLALDERVDHIEDIDRREQPEKPGAPLHEIGAVASILRDVVREEDCGGKEQEEGKREKKGVNRKRPGRDGGEPERPPPEMYEQEEGREYP